MEFHQAVFSRWSKWTSVFYDDFEEELRVKEGHDVYSSAVDPKNQLDVMAFKLFSSLSDADKLQIHEISFHRLANDLCAPGNHSFVYIHDRSEIQKYLVDFWTYYVTYLQSRPNSAKILDIMDSDVVEGVRGGEVYLLSISISTMFSCMLFQQAVSYKTERMLKMIHFCNKLMELQSIYKLKMFKLEEIKKQRQNLLTSKEVLRVKYLNRFNSEYGTYIDRMKFNFPLQISMFNMEDYIQKIEACISSMDLVKVKEPLKKYLDEKIQILNPLDNHSAFEGYKEKAQEAVKSVITAIKNVYNFVQSDENAQLDDAQIAIKFFKAVKEDELLQQCQDCDLNGINENLFVSHRLQIERNLLDLFVDQVNQTVEAVHEEMYVLSISIKDKDVPSVSKEELEQFRVSLTKKPQLVQKEFDVLFVQEVDQSGPNLTKKRRIHMTGSSEVDSILTKAANSDATYIGYLFIKEFQRIGNPRSQEFFELLKSPRDFYQKHKSFPYIEFMMNKYTSALREIDLVKLTERKPAEFVLKTYQNTLQVLRQLCQEFIGEFKASQKSMKITTLDLDKDPSELEMQKDVINFTFSSRKVEPLMNELDTYINKVLDHSANTEISQRIKEINKFLQRYKSGQKLKLTDVWTFVFSLIMCSVRLNL